MKARADVGARGAGRRRVVFVPGAGQSGMTLIEVLLVVGMIGLMVGPIAGWVMLGMDQDVATRERNSESASIGLLRSVFVKDVASAKAVVAGTAAAGTDCPGGSGAATAPEQTVLQLRRSADQTIVYNLSSAPGATTSSVYRRVCTGGALSASMKVADRVAPNGLVTTCTARPNAATGDCGRVNVRVMTSEGTLISMTASMRSGTEAGGGGGGPVYVSPEVVLVASPVAVYRGEVVTLEASASSDPRGKALTFNWDFGDGTPVVSDADTTHAFETLGEFTVVLTVTNSDGTPASDFVRVAVRNRIPEALIGQPVGGTTTNMCTAVTFDGTGSNDDGDIGHGGGTIESYEWDYGDGEAASVQAVSHTREYRKPSLNGPFSARLEVIDDDGGRSAAVSRQITVDNRIPTVSIMANGSTAPVIATIGVAVSFTSQASDPDSVCDGGSLGYLWDFGDGTTSTDQNPSHTYQAAPTGNVTLTVTDQWNGSRTSNSIQVTANRSPRADFTSPSAVRAGDLVTFTDGSTDDDGDPLRYSWVFERVGPGYASTSTATSPHVRFTHNVTGDTFVSGVYNVTLTASDGRGGSSTVTKSITVTGAPRPNQPGISVSARCVSWFFGWCTGYDWDNTVSWTAVPSVSSYQVEVRTQYCHLWCEGWVTSTSSTTGTSKVFTVLNAGNMQARVRALDQYTGKYGDWSDIRTVSFG